MMLLVSELLQYTFVTGRFYGRTDPEAGHVKVELWSCGRGRLTDSSEPRGKEHVARLSLGKRERVPSQPGQCEAMRIHRLSISSC